uniref:Transport permease protein n=1 Tax=Desulfobacca acetoxidans TaxID=60893 RepID=A0A7C3UZK1_9BACT
MPGWLAVYLRELFILRRRLSRLLLAWAVSPLLYLIAFGYAMGQSLSVQGHTYLEFLLPGLIAMASMTQAFAIGSEINIARFYWHIFEEIQSAPVSSASFVLGETLAGLTRALLAASVIILLGALFGLVLSYNPYFWAVLLLNSFVFAALAVALAMVVESHADQALLNSLIITPMAFLGGTFFPVDRLPWWAQKVLYLLPLTHAAQAMRAAALRLELSGLSYLLLATLGAVSFIFAVCTVRRARD